MDFRNALLKQAYEHLNQDRIPQALQCYDAVLAQDPNDALSLNARGVCYTRMDQFLEAERDFRKALEIQPYLAIVFHNLAQACLYLGKEKEALNAFERYKDLSQRGCPYFKERLRDRSESLPLCPTPSEKDFEHALSLGFRRKGDDLGRNICSNCSACVQNRILIHQFTPSRGQFRVVRKAADLRIEVGDSFLTPTKLALYTHYVQWRHSWPMADYTELARQVHESYERSLEVNFYLGEDLVAVGVADPAGESLYASEFYYSQKITAYSPGIMNILCLIQYGRMLGKKYLYLGEYIEDLPGMSYKKSFSPQEILVKGEWIRR